MLCKYVKGHATAEAALAALAARRRRGGQTCLPVEAEKALALLVVTQWKAGLTLTTEQVVQAYSSYIAGVSCNCAAAATPRNASCTIQGSLVPLPTPSSSVRCSC